jgi:hypothetical protein
VFAVAVQLGSRHPARLKACVWPKWGELADSEAKSLSIPGYFLFWRFLNERLAYTSPSRPLVDFDCDESQGHPAMAYYLRRHDSAKLAPIPLALPTFSIVELYGNDG